MHLVADLHIHSRFSRACSRALTLGNIELTCRRKGVGLVATGDFTYPEWFAAIEEELEESGAGSGLYRLKRAREGARGREGDILFVLATELALIYKQDDRTRRVHMVVQAPSIEAARTLNEALDRDYNIRSDGRPILGMSIEALYRLALSIDPGFFIYPAHIWTPWYSIFGSKSGFDTLAEAFGEVLPDLYAYETGLSSDPAMNWRISALDRLALLSNSDAHSLENIAREANIFELQAPTYAALLNAIKSGSPRAGASLGKDQPASRLLETIEFYPEEGMYHYDGHRDCAVRLAPAETRKRKGICPKCGKPLTVGVEYRVNELADRAPGLRPEGAPGFRKLVELDKIIAESLGVKSRHAKQVRAVYDLLIDAIGTELSVLMDAELPAIAAASDARIAEGVRRVRAGEVITEPGFDGVYGRVRIWGEAGSPRAQPGLF